MNPLSTFMRSRVFNLVAILILLLVHTEELHSQSVSSEIEQLFAENYPYATQNRFDEESVKKRLHESFGHLSDSEKIDGLLFMVMKFESMNPMTYRTDISVPLTVRSADGFITDLTGLKNRLASEDDPRRFYLISKLGSILERQQKADLVSSRIHMLFSTGKVANISVDSEYYRPEFSDVGVYTYKSILYNLETLNSDYEVPPENPDLAGREKFESNRIDLARWLKSNWPGCEDLEIPGEAVERSKRKAASVPDSRVRPAERFRPAENAVVGASGNGLPRIALICASGVLVMLALATYVFRRQSKS